VPGPTGSTGPAPLVTTGPTDNTVYIGGVLVTAAPGPTGPQGNSITGPQGAASTVPGPTGSVGATGPQGAASTVPGPTGAQGNSITGPTGPASTVPGPTGSVGPSVTGPTGSVGPRSFGGIQLGVAAVSSTLVAISDPGGSSPTNVGNLSLVRSVSYFFVPEANRYLRVLSQAGDVLTDGVTVTAGVGQTLEYRVPRAAGSSQLLRVYDGSNATLSTITLTIGDFSPTGPAGAASTVPGPTGPQGLSITGPAGAASTVPGPTGAAGAASTVPGPTGPAGGPTGPQGPAGTGGVSLGLVLALS